jgi:MEKHLA domain
MRRMIPISDGSSRTDKNDDGIPVGRVVDMVAWVELSSKSLYQQTGQSLFDRMDGVETVAQVHRSTRYAVLSHGTQPDPIYCYFNDGALLTFQWPESEIYQKPSRYSAPAGPEREDRQVQIETAAQQGDIARVIPSAIRQTKTGEVFELVNVLLWNVYDDHDGGGGERVGQTALFDRELLRPILLPGDDNDGTNTTKKK